MPGALMVVEDKEEGQVAWSVYWRYITCYGRWAALALLVFWSGEETTSVLTNWWLSKWSTAETLNAVQGQAGEGFGGAWMCGRVSCDRHW